MGIANSAGGDGLVAYHAYSLIGVKFTMSSWVKKEVTIVFTKKEEHDNELMIVVPPPE